MSAMTPHLGIADGDQEEFFYVKEEWTIVDTRTTSCGANSIQYGDSRCGSNATQQGVLIRNMGDGMGGQLQVYVWHEHKDVFVRQPHGPLLPGFQRLPKELKIAVWKAALPPPRLLVFGHERKRDQLGQYTEYHFSSCDEKLDLSLYNTSKESRLIFLENYEAINITNVPVELIPHSTPLTGVDAYPAAGVFFDAKRDILKASLQAIWTDPNLSLNGPQYPVMLPHAENLVLDARGSRIFHMLPERAAKIWKFCQQVPGLKNVYLGIHNGEELDMPLQEGYRRKILSLKPNFMFDINKAIAHRSTDMIDEYLEPNTRLLELLGAMRQEMILHPHSNPNVTIQIGCLGFLADPSWKIERTVHLVPKPLTYGPNAYYTKIVMAAGDDSTVEISDGEGVGKPHFIWRSNEKNRLNIDENGSLVPWLGVYDGVVELFAQYEG